MKKIWKIVPALAPILAVSGVAVGAAVSLDGYTVPAYGMEDFQITKKADVPAKTKRTQTAVPTETPAQEEAVTPTQEPQAKGAFDLKDGTYQGTGTGYRGEIMVSVKIQDQSAGAIEILSHSDDEAFFNRAKEGVISSILSAQRLDVDTVTGATYSSRGIIQAVKNALTGESDTGENTSTEVKTSNPTSSPTSTPRTVSIGQGAFDYADGTYEGSAEGFSGQVRVSVTVKDKTITAIEILSHSDDEVFFNRAKEGVISSILSAQRLDVDTVTGATYSSSGIIGAVKNALTGVQSATTAPQPVTVPPITSAISNQKPAVTIEPAAPTGLFPYPNGAYTGVGEGFGGDIAVIVVIKNKTIQKIQITSHDGEDDAFFQRAKTIVDQIIQNQSTKVDVITGATYSSQGILEGVGNALKAAQEAADSKTEVSPKPQETPKPEEIPKPQPEETPSPQEPTPALPEESSAPDNRDDLEDKEEDNDSGTSFYLDGEYMITVPCTPDMYEDFAPYGLTLTLVMENDKIAEIKNISGDGGSENASYIRRAVSGSTKYPGVVSQILEKNSLEDIDAVSHATCSSQSILEACRQALKKAQRQQE